MVIFRQFCVRRQARVDFHNRVETVQLVSHRGCKYSFVLIPHDGCWEVVICFWVLDVLETHAHRNQLVPCSKSFGLKEVGCIVGSKCLVYLEGCYLCRNCLFLVTKKITRETSRIEAYCVDPSRSCHRLLLFRLSRGHVSILSPSAGLVRVLAVRQ